MAGIAEANFDDRPLGPITSYMTDLPQAAELPQAAAFAQMADLPQTVDLPQPIMIGDMAEEDRPRERLWRLGAESLKDEELLAIILRIGHGGTSVIDLARSLLHMHGNSLATLAQAHPADLCRVKGIGKAKAAELKATFALAMRMSNATMRDRMKFGEPETVYKYLREKMRDKTQEEMWVLLMDTKNRYIREELVTRGLLDRSAIHAREVFRPAIQHNAAKLLLTHNHPSGDPTPSAADITSTKTLIAASKIIGIDIVDHMIIGSPQNGQTRGYFSFREHNMM